MATDAVLPRDTTRSEQQLLLPFRLWTVRVAVITTGLALVALAIYPALPGHEPVEGGPYVALIITAALGAAVISLLPWRRLLMTPGGMSVFYLWSALDILLVTWAIGVTGGGRSPLFTLYALT